MSGAVLPLKLASIILLFSVPSVAIEAKPARWLDAAAQGLPEAGPADPFIMVEAADDGSPLILLGFMAHGDESDLDRLGAAARILNIPSQRLAGGEEGGPADSYQMTMFPPGTARDKAVAFYQQARSGAFGLLRFEVIVISLSDAADGIDLETEVTVEPADLIVEPA